MKIAQEEINAQRRRAWAPICPKDRKKMQAAVKKLKFNDLIWVTDEVQDFPVKFQRMGGAMFEYKYLYNGKIYTKTTYDYCFIRKLTKTEQRMYLEELKDLLDFLCPAGYTVD